MQNKRAIITGITGQDGSYLAELLLSDKIDVIGTRRCNHIPWELNPNLTNAQKIAKNNKANLSVFDLDLTSTSDITKLVKSINPDFIFNLAAQSHVGQSFLSPEYTLNVTGLGAVRFMDAMFESASNNCRFYQASTSELFGGTSNNVKLNSKSKFNPKSPYATAKLLAHQMGELYRKRGSFVSCGILFNHESERRGYSFVTRKITSTLAMIKKNRATHLTLGTLEPTRDWGYAPDYVIAMRDSLLIDYPASFVVGTGNTYSIKTFLLKTAQCLDIAEDQLNHILILEKSNPRPIEVTNLIADESEALSLLNWKATTSLDAMIEKMVAHDMDLLK